MVGHDEKAPSPDALRANIDHALARHAAHAAAHIDVQVEPGRVILRGMAPSLAERQVIEGAVRSTPGVSRVETYISIR